MLFSWRRRIFAVVSLIVRTTLADGNDQMTQAARSAPANIEEGNSRHSTSKETEMKLTDVARATLSELANDYLNWLLRHERRGPYIRQNMRRFIVRDLTGPNIKTMFSIKAAYIF